jgi:hypothetical protein
MKPATACREDNNNIDTINMTWQQQQWKVSNIKQDASNSSRNSQLGMANLCYFDIIDVSTLQRPVLLLCCAVLSTLQRRVLHLDVSTLQRHVRHIDVSTLQMAVLNLDVSTLQRSLLHLDVSTSWGPDRPVLLLKVSTHRYLR